MINVCVPVLKRYDLLHNMFNSLKESLTPPDCLYIIDNGGQTEKLLAAIDPDAFRVRVHRPQKPMGVAESWNWFINRVSENRIITNDDVLFAPGSLDKILTASADLVWASGFSCFLIRDACVARLGLFDEKISPGYGYYEDDDYLQRLDGRGTRTPSVIAENVDAGVVHLKSQTLQAMTHAEVLEHHRRFKIAQTNYVRKWPHVAPSFPEVDLGVMA